MGNARFLIRQSDNSESSNCPVTLRAAVTRAADILRALPEEPTAADVEQIRELHETLTHAVHWHIPKITLWCVVKHYANHDPKTHAWVPAIWCAFLSQEQAAAFRTACDEHYNREARGRGWSPDVWTVERRLTDPTNIINPNMTAAEYVAGLR